MRVFFVCVCEVRARAMSQRKKKGKPSLYQTIFIYMLFTNDILEKNLGAYSCTVEKVKKLLRDKTLLLLSVNTNKINIHTDCVIVLH